MMATPEEVTEMLTEYRFVSQAVDALVFIKKNYTLTPYNKTRVDNELYVRLYEQETLFHLLSDYFQAIPVETYLEEIYSKY